MKNTHCKELDNILNSKPHIFERYGIILIIGIISVICIAGFSIEHIEKIDASSLLSIIDCNGPKYKIKLRNGEHVLSLVGRKFILNARDNRIVCKGLSTISNGKSDGVSLVLQPICIADTTALRDISLQCKNDDLCIEIHQNYFQIVISPMFSLFNKDN